MRVETQLSAFLENRAGVNIEYAYGSSPVGGGRAVVYVHASDLKKARAALAAHRGPRRR